MKIAEASFTCRAPVLPRPPRSFRLAALPALGSRFRLQLLSPLNIASIRSVIRKPPTTLIVAEATATKPRIVLHAPVLAARGDDRADERDARDRVGRRHERRVQQRRHARDDLVADEAGEDEDVELGMIGMTCGSPPVVLTSRHRARANRSGVSSPCSGDFVRMSTLARRPW